MWLSDITICIVLIPHSWHSWQPRTTVYVISLWCLSSWCLSFFFHNFLYFGGSNFSSSSSGSYKVLKWSINKNQCKCEHVAKAYSHVQQAENIVNNHFHEKVWHKYIHVGFMQFTQICLFSNCMHYARINQCKSFLAHLLHV